MDGELELLGERIAEMSAHLDAATHRLLTDLREFDHRGGWHRQGAASCAHWLAWRVGWDLSTAREHVRVARKLGDLPAIDDALRRGQVSYAKTRAMVRIATPADEGLLLEYAKLMTASQLEIQCRKYALVLRHGENPHPLIDQQRRHVRRRDTEDGMVKIEAVLHPEEAEIVWAMLDHAAAEARPNRGVPARDDGAQPSRRSASAADVPAGSAESPAMEDVRPGSALPVADINACRNASAEAQGPRTAAALQYEEAAKTETDVSAESRKSDGGGESLLEMLQDEAESIWKAGTAAEHAGECLQETTARSEMSTSRTEASILRQREDAAKRAFNRADALVSIAQGYLRGDRPERSPIEITLTVSESCLRGETVDATDVGEFGQSCVSREAARRLTCDAGVVEVVEEATGAPLSVGRKRRTISGSLKRALYRRDQGCTFPGCTHRIFLEGHHIKHWADGGETSLSNSALLCSLHHRYVHEYGYSIELGPDQRPRFRDRYGHLVEPVPERVDKPDLGWPWIRSINEPLAITADTIGCWDGTPVDYGMITGHLLTARELRT